MKLTANDVGASQASDVDPFDSGTSQSLQLLMVEDCKADAFLFQKLLHNVSARKEFAVTQVERLSDAIRIASQTKYDAAIVDLSLPDCSGVYIIRAIQAVAPRLPIIVYTGTKDPTLRKEAQAWGVTHVVCKGRENGFFLRHVVEQAITGQRD